MTALTFTHAANEFMRMFPEAKFSEQRVSRGTRRELYAEFDGKLAKLHFETDKSSRVKADERPITFAVFAVSEVAPPFTNYHSDRWGSVDSPTPPTVDDLVKSISTAKTNL